MTAGKSTIRRFAVALTVGAAVGGSVLSLPAAHASNGASLAVTPDRNLVNGQTVTVDGTGFAPNKTVYALECTPKITSTFCETSTLRQLQTAADGSFSSLHMVIKTGAVGRGSCTASTSCVIAATTDLTGKDPSQMAVAQLSFAVTHPTTTVARSSATSVASGQMFTITGTVRSKGHRLADPTVLLYDKLGTKHDRVGLEATLVAHVKGRPDGTFRFHLKGLNRTAHYIVELPATTHAPAYLLSFSKVLTVHHG